MGIVFQMNPNDSGDCGTFDGIDKKPTAGQTQYTITAQMASRDLTNPGNSLYLVILVADDVLGEKYSVVAKSSVWQSGPGAQEPSLTYPFPTNPVNGAVIQPTSLKGRIVNGLGGNGNISAPAVTLVDNI